ncbi:uncharacterized protein LOC9640555 isoform X3 [Selaginella moellendorffii]|uniref:uncharacterized protein LOC9640555 isoform X3 n=1 Tax=Selaginella moellendorffii TaxID=88036 RepID=UPI000D1CB493|nr:uncharacterized protein LOC9640555 isoform X3 [Selaginella moellendorffii]|eukprot:XP_024515624.1 uncharacterized protein LOC9640555 isoform X3 [Selaginella moellendorffii]
MTWARARSRVSDFSMGIGANAAARIEREHSCAAVERLVGELRQEVAFRDKRKKELEFLEKGGNPLDFEYGDLVSLPSTLSVVLSDSEAKERKLFVLQNNIHPKHGILTELLVSRLQRNGEFNEPIKQVLRRGTLSSIVRVKEEKSGTPPPTIVADPKAENGSCASSHSIDARVSSVEATTVSKSPLQEGNREEKNGIASQEDIKEEGSELVVTEKKSEEEILGAAISIKAVADSAAKKPLSAPPTQKSHWDFVLEEMAWMANDFMQERLWKASAAAHLCRSASQAPFWATAEAFTKSSTDIALSKDTQRLPFENYAIKFLANTMESPPSLKAPCTPELKERAVSLSNLPLPLHYIIPPGVAEAYRTYIEDSWASAYDYNSRRQSSQDSDSELEDDLLKLDNDVSYATGLKKKRRQQDEFNYIIPAKKQRTVSIPGRQRSDKKSKKLKSNKSTKGTDSENEWVPEACYSEKPKRKRDQFFGNKSTDLSGFKRPKLSNLISRKSILRKQGEFCSNGTGNGSSWSSLEDQAILVLEHDFGGNWKLLSDILNNGSHIKGHFRSSKSCQERHMFLEETAGDPSVWGILKGSAMLLLQKLQGPLEHDTLKLHFEEIVKAKQRYASAQRDQPPETVQPHESHVAIIAQAQRSKGRFLSPLDFPEDQGESKPGGRCVKRETASEPKTLPSQARNPQEKNNNDTKDGPSSQPSSKPDGQKIARNGQVGRKAGTQKQQIQRPNPVNSVKQEPLQRISSDAAKIEQQPQTIQAQQPHAIQAQQQQPPQRNFSLQKLEYRQEQHQPQQLLGITPRPTFQQKQKLPACSTSTSQQLPAHKSFAEQHHQHHFSRPPQSMQQSIQQPGFHYNSRCFAAGPGPQARAAVAAGAIRAQAPGGQWRPSQSSAHTYSHAVDAPAFRFQNQSSGRPMKQAQRSLAQHHQQAAQPQQCGVSYLPSSMTGAVRYQASHAAVPAKTWSPSERPTAGTVVTSSPPTAAAAADPPPASCK